MGTLQFSIGAGVGALLGALQNGTAVPMALMIESNRMWRELHTRLGTDIDWVQGGNLRLTDSADRAADYRRWIETAKSLGLDSRVATREEVGQILPGFTGEYLEAIFTPSDGQVNPVKAVQAYTDVYKRQGMAWGWWRIRSSWTSPSTSRR